MAKKNTGGNNMSVRITINGQEININGENGNPQRDDDKSPKTCPQCGDTIEGESKICASCDYNSDEDTMKGLLMELEELMGKLRIYRPGFGVNKQWLLTSIDDHIITIRSGYGARAEVREKLKNYEAEKEAIVKKQKKDSTHFRIGCVGLFVIIGVVIIFFKNSSSPTPTPEEKIGKLIKEGNIGKAKALLPDITNISEKVEFRSTLDKMEVDSLVKAKNYDEALQVARQTPDLTDQFNKTKDVIKPYVNELVKNKEFTKARDKTALLGDIYLKDTLSKMIDLAEKQVNQENRKKVDTTNKKKHKNRKRA